MPEQVYQLCSRDSLPLPKRLKICLTSLSSPLPLHPQATWQVFVSSRPGLTCVLIFSLQCWLLPERPQVRGGRRAKDGVCVIHSLGKELSTSVSKPGLPGTQSSAKRDGKTPLMARESRALLEGRTVPDMPGSETVQRLLRQRSWERRMQMPN